MKKKHINIEEIEKYYRIEEDGMVFSYRKNRYLGQFPNTAGYFYVAISTDTTRLIAAHRLVATKYLGQCPEHLETSHKDGNSKNNHYSNLEYITHAKNILKSYQEHGRVFHPYQHNPMTDASKLLMSNAKLKPVIYTLDGCSIRFGSIEEAAIGLNTYRKRIYLSIKNGVIFNGGLLTYE